MTQIRENVLSALRALTQNVMRSILTVTGIVIGVLAIVTLVAILQGVKAEIRHQVEGLGANLVVILPSKLDESGNINPAAMMGISSLTDEDVNQLRKVEGVEKISPVYFVAGTAEGSDKKVASSFVVATNRDGIVMNPTPLAEGRYFNDSEQHVCVLGAQPKQDLFGNSSALGKKIRVRDVDWTVVGVLQKPKNDGTLGSQMTGLSTLIYLPASNVAMDLPGANVNRIFLQIDYKHLNANHPAAELIRRLNQALLVSHKGREDFGVLTSEKGLNLVFKLLNMAQALLVLIAAISLFVAGVGIMNIMLVTVTERTREIGVRKTVGAKRADIFLQFLTEAIILSLVGCLIGLALSWTLCALIARYSALTPLITPGVIGMALIVCITVGILFGVTPAVRASKLNPIDALRHE